MDQTPGAERVTREAVSVVVRDRVAEVVLDNPPVNAVTLEMYERIADTFTRIEEWAPGARVVILRSEGKHFCGGNDLHEFETLTPDNSPARMAIVRRAFFAIHECVLPVIGAVQGSALGTGLAIAASCDFVVAAEGAKLGLPELSVGVMGGASHLARLVPQPIVRSMFFSSDPVAVEDLRSCGAVVDVVPAAELLDAVRRRAERIARHSPAGIRIAKATLNAIEFLELKPGYEYEQQMTGELSAHPDSKEAVRAFFERREPVYAEPARI